MSHYDIVIIGAGPAGMACAISLQNKGIRPCVIDKAEFPRHKTCGGLITKKSEKLIRRLLSYTGDNLDDILSYIDIESGEASSTVLHTDAGASAVQAGLVAEVAGASAVQAGSAENSTCADSDIDALASAVEANLSPSEEVIFSNTVSKVALYYKTHKLVETPFDEPVHFVHREDFDNRLVEKYKSLGGLLLEGEKDYFIDYQNRKIVFADGREISFKYLVMADGALSQIHRYLRDGIWTETQDDSQSTDVQQYSRFQKGHNIPKIKSVLEKMAFGVEVILPKDSFPEDSMSLRFGYGKNGYIWVFPYGDAVCAGACAPYKDMTDCREMLEKFLKKSGIKTKGLKFHSVFTEKSENEHSGLKLNEHNGLKLHDRIINKAGDEFEELEFSGAFFPSGWIVPQEDLPDYVFLAGDAAGFADPISGEGIFFALRSGMNAAYALMTDWPKENYYIFNKPIRRIIKEGARLQNFFFMAPVQHRFLTRVKNNPTFPKLFFDSMVPEYKYGYNQMLYFYVDYKKKRKEFRREQNSVSAE